MDQFHYKFYMHDSVVTVLSLIQHLTYWDYLVPKSQRVIEGLGFFNESHGFVFG